MKISRQVVQSKPTPRLGAAAEKEAASKWAIAAGIAGLVGVLALVNMMDKKK